MLLARLNPLRRPPRAQRYTTAPRGTYPVTVTHPTERTSAPVLLFKQRAWTSHEHTALTALLLTPAYTARQTPLTTHDWADISQKLSSGRPHYRRSPQACKQRIERLVRRRAWARLQWGGLVERPRWTRRSEALLLSLRLVEPRGGWAEIAQAVDAGFSPRQCATKYARLAARQSPYGTLAAAAVGGGRRGLPGLDFNATPVRPSGDYDAPVPRWSAREERVLRQLVGRAGVFDFRSLRQSLPGFRYSTMYRALRRIFFSPNTPARGAARDNEGLPKEVEKEEEGRVRRAVRWSPDEHVRLVRAVEACRGRAAAVAAAAQEDLQVDSPLAMLPAGQGQGQDHGQGEGEGQGEGKLPALLRALSRDTGRPEAPNVPEPQGKIDWTLVATQLADTQRTPAQCCARWYNTRQQPSSTSVEPRVLPWSLAEDALLYARHRDAPGRWTWIARGLPGRSLVDLRVRMTCLQKHVGLLRACRGESWDPLWDGLVEVHDRCEIAMWYAADMPGYRKDDPVACPYDLDLTGISRIAQESA
ncbi:hypothetical protein LPJ53_000475 [Coemansia erecta]|uniref:Myb-like domain-containing protein n=1 Tax=Coemansia erecta TaxID=147472 RepID=A0A9W7Y6Z4_9FUNG|nr:hypothetical protein LPJ53_000475 [Coemansia erecta]